MNATPKRQANKPQAAGQQPTAWVRRVALASSALLLAACIWVFWGADAWHERSGEASPISCEASSPSSAR